MPKEALDIDDVPTSVDGDDGEEGHNDYTAEIIGVRDRDDDLDIGKKKPGKKKGKPSETRERRQRGKGKVQSPLETYLHEINAFPLLTPAQEKAFAFLHEQTTGSIASLSAQLQPHVIAALGGKSALGDELRKALQRVKHSMIGRFVEIQTAGMQDEPAEGSTERIPLEANTILSELIKKAFRGTQEQAELGVEENADRDDATLVKNLFALMKKMSILQNRICTSNIEEVGALVSSLERAFHELYDAFPPDHPCQEAIDTERQSAHGSISDNEVCKEYLEQLPKGALSAIDKNTPREILIRANLRLVVSIARAYTGKGLGLQDLIEEGNFGLMRAADGFDPQMGTRFSTYASYWIKQSIKRAIANTSRSIRIPAYMVEILAKWRRATQQLKDEQLAQQPDRSPLEPTTEDVMRKMGMPRKKMGILLQAKELKDPLSLNKVPTNNGEAEFDVPAEYEDDPSARMEGQQEIALLFECLEEMDERERTVLELRFGLTGEEPMTLKEIGEQVLKITRERVRQIEADALANLQLKMEEKIHPTDRTLTQPAEEDVTIEPIAHTNGTLKRVPLQPLSDAMRKRYTYQLSIIAEIDQQEDHDERFRILRREKLTPDVFHQWRGSRAMLQEALAWDTTRRNDETGLAPAERARLRYRLAFLDMADRLSDQDLARLLERDGVKPALLQEWRDTRTSMRIALLNDNDRGNGKDDKPVVIAALPPLRGYDAMASVAADAQGACDTFEIQGILMLALDNAGRIRFLNALTDLKDVKKSDREQTLRAYLDRNGFSAVPDTSVEYVVKYLDLVTGQFRAWMSGSSNGSTGAEQGGRRQTRKDAAQGRRKNDVKRVQYPA